MRIGLVTDLTQLNAIYRGLPVLQLAEKGHEVCLGIDGERLRVEALERCDVVHICRYQDGPVRQLAQGLRDAGVAIVWDNDDDLTSQPEGIAAATRVKGALRSQQVRSDIVRMLRLAHVVTTPSATLAEQYRAWGAEHVELVENFIPQEYAVDVPPPRDGVTIGWAAAEEHRYDEVKLGIRDTLGALLDRHPELRVASIGLDLRLRHERYRHRPPVQYEDLARHVAAFDIGIAPLADIAFNRARSNVKLKEYAAVGVAWLASPVGPYLGLGEAQGGQLVPDDGWSEALERLIADARRRRTLGKRGRKWARRQTVARNVAAWERAFTGAIDRAGRARAR